MYGVCGVWHFQKLLASRLQRQKTLDGNGNKTVRVEHKTTLSLHTPYFIPHSAQVQSVQDNPRTLESQDPKMHTTPKVHCAPGLTGLQGPQHSQNGPIAYIYLATLNASGSLMLSQVEVV